MVPRRSTVHGSPVGHKKCGALARLCVLRTFTQPGTTTIIQSGEAPFLTGEEPPPHSGELNRALSQAGGPTQSQLSRPLSSGHHVSVEQRLRRKHLLLNLDTNARSGTKLGKLKKKHIFRKKTNILGK